MKVYHVIDLIKAELKKSEVDSGQYSHEAIRLEEMRQLIQFCTALPGISN